MNRLECNCSWHFAKQQDVSKDIGPNNAAEEHFSATPYPSLIRESIQNSLDVVLDSSKPVRMKFEFGKLRSSTFEAFYELREHIKGVIELYGDKAKPMYENMLNKFNNTFNNQTHIGYIKVSDFNTKGMAYDFNAPENSPFFAFVRAEGLTVKSDESSGGSFGFGKAAYFAMSPIHTFLVSTMTEDHKTYFEGAANLCTHYYTDENGNRVKYQDYGYYDNQGGKCPASLSTDIPTKFYRDEIGTDIYIMGVDISDEEQRAANEEMIKATLRHFWLAIYDGRLEVQISNVIINKDSLDELMSKLFTTTIDRTKKDGDYNPRPYYEAVKNSGSSCNYILVTDILQNLGHVSLFVWKNKEAKDSIVYMRKQRMFIYRSRQYTSNCGFYAVFVCTDDRGNKLLKSIEDPSHRKWEENKNKPWGKIITKEISDFISNTIQDLFSSERGGALGITGLEDYLFVPEELISTDREGVKDNPFFGEPSDETQEEGTSPISIIAPPDPHIAVSTKEALGKVVTISTQVGGERQAGGAIGGHKRGSEKKKKRGSGNSPDTTGFNPTDEAVSGEFLENIPVHYRVMAENKNGRIIHTIIINSDFDVQRGKIEVVVNGEENDEEIDIVSSSMGTPDGNTVSNLTLSSECKNEIQLTFADNMKHAIKLTAYEFK